MRGGDLSVNQSILEAVLQGRGETAQRDVVAFNTALVLWTSGLRTISRALRHERCRPLIKVCPGSDSRIFAERWQAKMENKDSMNLGCLL